MTIENEATRQAMLEDFGDSVSVASVTMWGIFDNEFLDVLDTQSANPQLLVSTADIPSIAFGDAVIVTAFSFTGTVREWQPDGQGMTLLMLHKT